MTSQVFTYEAQLHSSTNEELVDYLESASKMYCSMRNKAFAYLVKNGGEYSNRSEFNAQLRREYPVLKREANSAMIDAKTLFNMNIELLRYNISQLYKSIGNLKKQITILIKEINSRKEYLRTNPHVTDADRHSFKNLRKKLIARKNKLNTLIQRLSNLEYKYVNKKPSVCFGTKKLMRSDTQKFLEKKYNQMVFTGSSSETFGNQMCQLRENGVRNSFEIKLRTDNSGNYPKYVYGKVHFPAERYWYIVEALYGNEPISYRFIRKNNRWYIQVMLHFSRTMLKPKNTGALGVDFNKGHIDATLAAPDGNIKDTFTLTYRFASGNKTTTDMEEICNEVASYAEKYNAPVILEKLNFSNKKSALSSGYSKDYNRMLSSLAYTKFASKMNIACFKRGVVVCYVNPYNTSKLGKRYAEDRKLNSHVAASYVIARRGLGFSERV